MQERVLRFLHDDFASDYLTLLKASGSVSMEVRRMRYLGVEIYKTLNDLKPGYMKDTKSILYEGAKIWNHLPNSLKSAETIEIFTNLMKTWEGPNCKCNFCKHLVSQ